MRAPNPLTPSPRRAIPLSSRRKLTLLDELGNGSAGVVYKALVECDAFVRRLVAVKIFDLGASDEPESALLSLGRAAQRAAYIVHPNVVQTFEMAHVGPNQVAVLTELVEGTTLDRLLAFHARAGRRLPLDLALFIATEIAEALSGARVAATPEGVHAGLAHLDVSPHQALLSFHGEVKLSDFGLAQIARWGSGVRRVSGTGHRWASVAPEIATGRGGDARSDVFSLGVLLREMLLGPRFGPEVSDAEALEHARTGHVPSTFLELQLAPPLRAILSHALEPDPARRYTHATAMAFELRRVALKMGVGDGRVFLRTAIAEQTTAATIPPPASATTTDPDTKDEKVRRIVGAGPDDDGDRSSGLMLRSIKPERSARSRRGSRRD
jgi:serine/threonine protein kinase